LWQEGRVPSMIRYRLLTDDRDWFVQWRCGSRWLLVYGPASEAQAREWIDAMAAQAL
jgi:hypothetical protein